MSPWERKINLAVMRHVSISGLFPNSVMQKSANLFRVAILSFILFPHNVKLAGDASVVSECRR